MRSEVQDTIASLYKTEARRLTYLLAKKYSLDRYGEAEDIIQYAFEKALTDWADKQIPDSPLAWIYQTARNKALDFIKSKKGIADFNMLAASGSEPSIMPSEPEHIKADIDSTLLMAFVCCNPGLPFESQVALALRTLFSLSVDEVARALSISYVNAEKRLNRARKSAAEMGIRLELPANYHERLPAVLAILYLCFNEGYYSRSKDPIRFDLCTDTIALVHNLLQDDRCQTPATYALMSLCCFHAARLKARLDNHHPDETIILAEQDRSNYDQRLINFGNYYLNLSATGSVITQYHLEAAIASVHCAATSYNQTDWPLIYNYYQQLLRLNNSPNIVLAGLVAKMKVYGAEAILEDYAAVATDLDSNYYYQMLGLEIARSLVNHERFEAHKVKALALAATDAERQFTEGQTFSHH